MHHDIKYLENLLKDKDNVNKLTNHDILKILLKIARTTQRNISSINWE